MTSYAEMSLARSMSYLADSQSAISNNLANATTASYKRKTPVAQTHVGDFHSLLSHPLPTITYTEGTDFTAGSQRAASKMDVALAEGQFFRVENANGTFYTRRGELIIDSQGRLVTTGGDRFLGSDGQPITIGPNVSEMRIASNGIINGRVEGNDVELGRFGVFQVADPHQLVSMGASLYHDRGAQPVESHPNPSIRQGYAEESNVDVLKELIQMITVQRSFGASTKALSTIDGIHDSYYQSLNR